MPTKEELDNEEETSEVEDHSSDESDNEEVEETSDDSEKEESDHSSEDEDEASLDKFIDPKDAAAAPEVHKRMFASFTKARQKLRKEFNQLEDALGTKYAQAVVKARALDNLSNMENFKLFLEDARENRPYGHSSVFNSKRARREEPDDEEDTDEPSSRRNGAGGLTVAQVSKIVREEVGKAVRPFQTRFANEDYTAMAKKYPDFNRYKADITELVQRSPGLSLLEAYKSVAFDDRISRRSREDEEDDRETRNRLKKKPRTEKPSSKSTGPINPPTVKTVKDAIEFALTHQE